MCCHRSHNINSQIPSSHTSGQHPSPQPSFDIGVHDIPRATLEYTDPHVRDHQENLTICGFRMGTHTPLHTAIKRAAQPSSATHHGHHQHPPPNATDLHESKLPAPKLGLTRASELSDSADGSASPDGEDGAFDLGSGPPLHTLPLEGGYKLKQGTAVPQRTASRRKRKAKAASMLPPSVLKQAKDCLLDGADAELTLIKQKAALWDNVTRNLTALTHHKRSKVADGARAFTMALALPPEGKDDHNGSPRIARTCTALLTRQYSHS